MIRGVGCVRGVEKWNKAYNSEAHDEGPEASLGVLLQGLHYGQLVLQVLALERVVHEVRVLQDLRVLDIAVSPLVQLALRVRLALHDG